MTEAPTYLHPDDGDLIRWVDKAMPPEERAYLEAHIATCDSCRTRQVRLAGRAATFAALLRTTDVAAPATALRAVVRRRRDRSTVAWKIAATVLLVIGAAAAVTPVRAWFSSVARTVLAGFGTTKGTELPEGSVSFAPVSSQLTIRVPARPGATLTIEIVEGDRVIAVGGQAGVLVLPEELRFADAGGRSDEYVVRAPLRTETIRVIVGESETRTFRPKAVGDRWVVPLDRPAR